MRPATTFAFALLALGSSDCGSSESHGHCDDVIDESSRLGCEVRLSVCSDGHAYRIACDDATHAPYSCACEVDGKTAKTVTSSTFCSGRNLEQADLDACGFDLR